MRTHDRFTVNNGLVTLGPEALELKRLLEKCFLGMAAQTAAVEMAFPPLLRAEDLERLDYFTNFPHLMFMASPIRGEHLEGYSKGTLQLVQGESGRELDHQHLAAGRYVLPPAACYSIYLHLRQTELADAEYVTVVSNCFRNEKQYEGLRRLMGFTMREIVCVGPLEAVRTHLATYKRRIQDFISGLGMPIQVQAATDPFYEAQGSRATLQQLFPVKEEFVYGGSLAIASVNFHRNFFGEKCGIRIKGGESAFSGCVAFGLERWLHALLDHFGGDIAAIRRALGGEGR